ncbi:MAG: hypothetical protein DRI95_12175 [Bacteroidetes bacterium]|nr:MAG: hypothetical protein DRI95_12175 [Bacteroidota bacterium]
MSFFQSPKVCKISGNSLTYYREGKGETILFVHGITTYSFIWRNIIPFFVEKYDVIAIDLLGCGDSDIPLNEDFSLKRQAVIIEKFVAKLNIAKLHLVGHDVGGGVAQIFAVNNTDLLFDMTLVNSVAYNFWPVQPIIAMQTPVIRQIAMSSLDMGMFELVVKRGLYHKTTLSDELMNFFWKPMKSKSGRKGFLHFAKCLNNKDLTEIEEKLQKLELPTLIIRGEKDVYLSAAISDKLYSEIPKSRLVKITTGGHFIQEDEPEKVSKAIIEFINIKDETGI